ncbi:uncharacterized protein LOC120894797 isoform X1 [Anopheles arabiensis]|uniref:uncharacterized protein LOC120894797 isoform X1 n=1 Tax=Anopheles arabiensis TaxID=7173 RepID=UPI001AAD6EE4|nr:uncharacterized protein LOC120894797 isoform X1 [Anopheles arabiensis]
MVGKDELRRALIEAGVDVPNTATLAQLRQLYASLELVARSPRAAQPTTSAMASASAYANHPEAAILYLPHENGGDAVNDAASTNNTTDANANLPSAQGVAAALPRCSDDMEAHLEALRMQLQLAELRQKVHQLEAQQPTAVCVKDFESFIEPLDAEKNSDVIRWFRDLERLFSLHRVCDADKFLFTLRLLTGTAANVAKEFDVTTYDELKMELIDNLHFVATPESVYRQLRNRRLQPQESALRYLFDMQRIAGQADIPDSELIPIVIDGLGSPSITSSLHFMPLTMEDFRKKLKLFESCRHLRAIKPPSAVVRAPMNNRMERPLTSQEPVRCFNCSRFGHLQSACSKPKRPPGGCFRCFQTGHVYRNCPERRANATVEGGISSEDTLGTNQEIQGVL